MISLHLGLIFVVLVAGQSDVFEDDLNGTAIQYLNVGVLMASNLGVLLCNSYNLKCFYLLTCNQICPSSDSPFDLERCGPAVDLALEEVNEVFLKGHRIQLRKVQGR